MTLPEAYQTTEAKPSYHYPEIASMEPSAIELVRQLKPMIDDGFYRVLLSDDVGGRLPTLMMRRIMRTRRPDVPLHTYFVAAGNYIPQADTPDYDKFLSHLRSIEKRLVNQVSYILSIKLSWLLNTFKPDGQSGIFAKL